MNDQSRIEKEKRVWEKLAKTYDKQTRVFENAYNLTIEKTNGLLNSNHKVLEIACGTGIVTLGVADSVNKVTAIDISPNMIKVAQEKAKSLNKTNIDFKIEDGYSLPYKDKEFDIILLFNILHLIKEPNQQLREAYRLLKSGGYLVTATDCYGENVPLKIKCKLEIQNILNKLGILPYLHNYRKGDLLSLFKTTGFSVIEDDILHSAPVNYYVLLQK